MALITADDCLWNWARWCWSSATVGNMETYIPWEDDPRPIMTDHARKVDEMHQALPWHERMVIIAEYPQKIRLFKDLLPKERMAKARRWIGSVTGVHTSETQYKLYLGLFKSQVGRKLL